MQKKLLVKNLSFRWPFRVIFSNINFEANPGDLFYISGENGCGKTTFLRVLAGELPPSAGTIDYFEDSNRYLWKQKRVQESEYLAADYNSLYLDLSALDNLQFWLSFRGNQTKRASSSLSEWGLATPVLQSWLPVKKLSTGLKRRVALARTFTANTPVIFLDEPANGLDQKGTTKLVSALSKALQTGKIVFITSHDDRILSTLEAKTIYLDQKGSL